MTKLRILFLLSVFTPITLLCSVNVYAATSRATITVAAGAVAISADGTCSLLEAINNAQDTVSGNVHSDCVAGDPSAEDIVELTANSTYTFDATTAQTSISSDVSINGNNATLDHQSAGFFDIAITGHLRLRALTLTGSDGDVAAISGVGALTVRNSTFSENINTTAGGAIDLGLIRADSVLDVHNTTFTNNVSHEGGAIYVLGNSGTAANAITIADSRFEGNGRWIGAPGITTDDGGAIRIVNLSSTAEEINITDTKFFENFAERGGAMRISGASGTISNSGFDGNEADSFGGAIYSASGADTRIEQSVISNNSAGSGGGIYNRGASLILNNTTVSGNTATTASGIYNQSAAGDSAPSAISLDFATVVNNNSTGNGAGGIYNTDNGAGLGGTIWIQNSIVYANSNSTGNEFDCELSGGSITSLGYNMGDDDPNAGCPFTETTDEEAVGNVSDHLVPLAENGGPTRTHALTNGSTAKNKIPLGSSGCTSSVLDQRGYLRSSGDGVRCDIGAYELGADTLPIPPTAVQISEQATVGYAWHSDVVLALWVTYSVVCLFAARRRVTASKS